MSRTAIEPVSRHICWLQRWPNEIHAPLLTETIQNCTIWSPGRHDSANLSEECRRIQPGSDKNILPFRPVGDIHKTMLGSAGDTHNVPDLPVEAASIHLVEIPSLQHSKYLGSR